MKLTNREMEGGYNTLNTAGEKECRDYALAVKMARNSTSLIQALKPVVEAQNRILREYGEKDEKGNLKSGEGGRVNIIDVDAYNREYSTLMDAPGEVQVEPFTWKEVQKMRLTPNQMRRLFPVIKE